MQPDLETIRSIISTYSISVEIVDLVDTDYSKISELIDLSKTSGIVVSLPYNYEIDSYLKNINNSDVTVIEFGGDYYQNDISVSINYTYVGYLIGKKMGDIFIKKGISSPKIGLYSLEYEWKMIEQGLIEGLREIVPEAYISGRHIVLMDGKITLVSGEDDFTKFDGICVFFSDTNFQMLSYSKNKVLARSSINGNYPKTDDLMVSLIIEDAKTNLEALTQFAEMINGNQTTKKDFRYKEVFEFVVS